MSNYNQIKNIDIIIIGAGLSGLTLARELSIKTKKKILIIERKKKLVYDKNWCFWNFPKNPLTKLNNHSWERIKIKVCGEEKLFFNNKIKYLHLKSSTFYDYMINHLRKKDVNIFMNKKINEIKRRNGVYEIVIDKTLFKTGLIFDSRPNVNKNKNNLYQHFAGYEVSFKQNILTKNEVILMDLQSFSSGVKFMYVLPFSKKKALFESTYFSQMVYDLSIYKKNVIEYLKDNFPNVDYKIKFKEKGVIPMFLEKKNNQENYYKIGTPGNWLRFSTGYGFQNAFINAEQIVNQIKNNEKIYVKKNNILNFLDEIFCNLIKRDSNALMTFFKFFYFKNDYKIIVKFLTGKINFIELFILIRSLPKKKLIISMIQVLKKKLYK
tara:strand:- start:490 stop:1629 length:1140 start_codon:yes stop_codon:yes gene_type:complete